MEPLEQKPLQTREEARPLTFERVGEDALSVLGDETLSAREESRKGAEGGKTYRQLVSRYKKRQHDTLVDTVTTGLSYADEVVVDLGLLEDTGLLGEMAETITGALPFAVIAVTEQAKVIMGKKTQKEAVKNTVYRMVKTGAAMGAGALAGAVAGLPAAIPAAIGVRALLDQHKSRAMLGSRILGRTRRLSALKEKMSLKKQVEDLTLGTGEKDGPASKET